MIKRIAMLSAVAFIGSSVAFADPFNPKAVPADARWVAHVDVDALVKSAFWEIVESRLNADANAQAKLQEFEQFTGMVFPQDLHSVTVVGMGFDDGDGIFLVGAKGNQEQLLTMLQMNPGYASYTHGTHEILGWDDNGKMKYGAFYSPDLTIIGDTLENIAKIMDSLDGKSPSAKPDSYMGRPTGPNVLASIAGEGITELAERDRNNPVLKAVQSGCVTIAQQGNDAVAHGTFNCGNEKMAQSVRAMAEGAKALGMVMAEGERPDPKLKLIAPLLPGAQASAKGSDVLIDWSVPVDDVKSVIFQVIQAKTAHKAKATTRK